MDLLTTLLALTAATSSPAGEAAVVRIEVASVVPNYLRPWEKSPQDRRMGSGFIVGPIPQGGARSLQILTNFHVIQDAVDIRVTKVGSARRWPAVVAAVGPDVDLALVSISEASDEFFKGLSAVQWSDSLPALQSRVHVRGFPLGGNTMCVTEGVVSRVDCRNYRLGPTAGYRNQRDPCPCPYTAPPRSQTRTNRRLSQPTRPMPMPIHSPAPLHPAPLHLSRSHPPQIQSRVTSS